MERLLTHSRFVLGAMLITVTAFFVVTAPAQAVPPTQAPIITAKPSDPNTTNASAVFSYTKGAGETETVYGFDCRQYRTANPPAGPGSGWANCGALGESGTRSYPDLTNESQTFDVRARNSASETGPVATYVWTQNVTVAPSLAPVLTDQPDDPMRDFPTVFDFEEGTGESGLANRYQCRIDGGPWEQCNAGDRTYENLANGEHTFEVRAGNQNGYGPVTTFTWTGAVPNPEPAISPAEAAITRLDGTVESGQIGGLHGEGASASGVVGLGDVNGDGHSDLAAGTSIYSYIDDSLFVIFGSRAGMGRRNLDTLGPDDGYKIIATSAGWNGLRGYRSIGDQNGDGVRDILVAMGQDNVTFEPKIFVVYGGLDPVDLPACPGMPNVRCLDLETISDDQGYALIGTGALSGNRELGAAGDFDGDGIEDFLLGNGFDPAYVVRGGERVGTTDVTAMPSDQVFRVIPVPGPGSISYAIDLGGIGDLNGDGKDDIYLGTQGSGGGYIVFGRSFGTNLDLSDFGPTDGIRVGGSPLSVLNVENLGDLNGDGRPDLAVAQPTAFFSATASDLLSVLYGPELPTSDPLIGGDDLVPGTGYLLEAGGLPGILGRVIENIGDFDNDGTPDMVTLAPRTPIDGVGDSGAAYVVFGKAGNQDEPVQLGPALTAEAGVAILGEHSGNDFFGYGQSVASIGDTDGDGLTDFAFGAGQSDPNGVTDAGSVFIIPGSSMINQVRTGNAAGIENDSVALNASVSTNNRASEVWFEYGTSTGYGQSTGPESFAASYGADATSATISGLQPNTTYHYRAVAKNDLGLTRYGDDRTFTTTNTGGGGSNCDTDNTLPGCSGYDHCKVKPADCQGSQNRAKLASLVVAPKSLKVKRGKKGSVSVIVVNTGGQSANGVKVCVKAPKKFVKVKKCQSVGSLASGATKTKSFKVTVKKKTKRGKKLALNFTASGNGLDSRKAKASIRVR